MKRLSKNALFAGKRATNILRQLATHQTTRRVAPQLLVFGLLIGLNCVGVYAQGSLGSVGEAVQRSWSEIYFQWRGPISILALLIAAVLLMTGGRNSYSYVAKIVIGVVIFALGPTLYATLSKWGTG